MSLIMDATKAAQREKERRESGAHAGTVPLLVPLRSAKPAEFSWSRMGAVALTSVVVLGAAWFIVQRTRNAVPRALRTPGPAVVSIASAPPVVDSSVSANRDTSQAAQPQRAAQAVAVLSTPVVPSKSASARPTRRASRPSARSAGGVTAETRPTASSGQMRIAVEEPRELEAARVFSIGVAAHRGGDLPAARSAYDRVLALVPTHVDALNNMGVLLGTLREFDRGEQMLRRAVSLDPGNAGAWNNLGTVLRERGRSGDAIAAFQHALSIDPVHQGARVSLAQQYLMIGSLAQARQLLEEVLVGNPGLPEANYALGQVLERLGDRQGAIHAYSAFVRAAPPGLAAYVESVQRRVDALGSQRP